MWEALLVLAAGAAAKYQANQQAADRQEKLRQAMEVYQRGKAREGEAATEELLTKQTPDARKTELADVTADRTQSLKDTVGAAQSFDAAPVAGKLSADYKAADESVANTRAERTRRAIEQLATMGAPTEVQRRFNTRFSRTAGDVQAKAIASQNVGNSYMTDIRNVVPNRLLSTLGDVGMAVGGGMVGGPAGAASGAAAGMGADSAGNFTYEDSAGNLQHSSTPYRTRVNRGFSLWGTQPGAQR